MPAAAWVSVPASDSRLQYTGRRYTSDAGVVFSHPGVTIRARFQGDAVRMRLNDFGLGGDVGTNYFDVRIDGGPPTQLAVHSGQTTYPLATGLAEGLHTVEIVKRTESSVGHSELVALEVHGELRDPPPRPSLRMEFVGDSITCGYGTDVSLIPESPSWRAPTFQSKHENPTRSYGWLTARHLGAEFVAVCHSGHGLYRNLDMTTSQLLPALYELSVPGHPVAWDFSRYSPDVIVINVGTNDVLAGSGTSEFLPDETAFKTAYRKFLARLRELHPRAHLVCTLGSMTDGFKQHEQGGTADAVHVGEWVTQLVEERNREGDARVYRHLMAVQNPGAEGVGEDWHPSAATHQKMAEALSRFLQDTVLR
ncbi:SGNH/GDSL hydrolase family protein [Pyxidicoccus xibeiensis]|uniref:SGNH/GDSL hydrolase family protein n=1 Tax=Pyxidicoccus xibeiensis TaxID=2906759 RepID=UPI0020A81088|nr:GDSL-type esterase/lipase family protein [Pyxidicoccus xibeiensis]MCP3141553.1 GDSL-type esterase/lipase family protein [Pyxidicoccus xibeiensis]